MTVFITDDVVLTIGREAQASTDGLETGGILLGHDRGDTFVLTTAGGPGPAAQRSPTSFLRDLDHARNLGDEAYQRDESVWLGEWHTHPGGLPAPSQVDVATALSHIEHPTLGFDRVLSLIVVAHPELGWSTPVLLAWVIDLAGAHAVPVELHTIEQDQEGST